MTGRGAHSAATRVLSLLMAAIGIALIVQVAGGHGGIASPRMLLGVLFILVGAGRLYLQMRGSKRT
jgi:hypothetical protein